MRNMQLNEASSTQTITISSHPVVTVEVQYNGLNISDTIDVTQFMTITTCATAVQSWNNPTSVSTTVHSWNNSTSISTAIQSWNTSVSDLYQQPFPPTSLSTQTSNSNESYPIYISPNGTAIWTNTSSSGATITSSLVVDYSPAPKVPSTYPSATRPYILTGSGVLSRRSSSNILFQLLVLMQILDAFSC